MMKMIISLLVILMLAMVSTGCATGKKNYSERRGLMLLETTQLGRNKGYYSHHKAKKIDHDYKKIVKKRKYN